MMKAQQRFKVLIIGETNVGKTSIVSKFIKGETSSNTNNTIGIDFVSTTIKVGDTHVRMQIWDTAGQERYRSITKAYYRGAQGVFIVFDLSSQKSFAAVDKWVESLNTETDSSTPKLLIGNKSDKFREDGLLEVKSLYNAKAKKYKMKFIAVSAHSGLNIDTIFCEMGKMLLETQKNDNIKSDVFSLHRRSQSRRGCC